MKQGEGLKASVDRDACIGSHACIRRLPEAFEADEEGKARWRESARVDEEDLEQVARGCPGFAIEVVRSAP